MYTELGNKRGRWAGEEVLQTIQALARQARRAVARARRTAAAAHE